MNIYRLTSFPKTENGGNKAGVVLDADLLTDTEMMNIAKEVGYSETAFVSRSNKADFKVRFFTPTSEVDLCGHATIATYNLMRDLERISIGKYTQETRAGILELSIEKDLVYMEQNLPVFGEKVDKEDINSCFDNQDFIHQQLPIQITSTGMREIFLPVEDVETLNSLKPNIEEIINLSRRFQVIGIHAFALADDCDAYGRNFAPFVGIDEESATGTSNGALGCYLNKYVISKSKYILRQGYGMNLPSEIITKLEFMNQIVHKVWVGGSAKQIKNG